jgi:adenosylmethionine-8-amino-7-oxononanoate aminotransferase
LSLPEHPDADQLARLDCGHVWHPFTPMAQYMAAEPTIIERAEGFWLIDTRGRRYIDGFSSLWCNLHGHRVPQIDDAIRRQLELAAHTTLLGFGSPPSILLARRLVEMMPQCMRGLTRVFYSDCGASAVEVALKMAFQFHHNRGSRGRRRFIALRDGYHGDTLGAVSVGGVDTFHRLFRPLLFDATFVDTPNPYYHPKGAGGAAAVLAAIDAAIAQAPDEYCAVIVEPLIQAAGGMLTHPGGFLRELRELTRRRGVLLIADEVATGFCRTGSLFACEQEGVCPDLLCLGKGLSGGYLPVAVTMATEEVFDAFLGTPGDGRTFYHGHTFGGNALGCAAALASVELIESSGLAPSLGAKVELMRRRLGELADHPNVGDIRQCGMMAGIEIVRDRSSRPHGLFDPARRIGAGVCDHARRYDVIIRPLDNIVVLMPAPAMDLATLDRLLTATVASVREHMAGVQ